MRQICTLIGAGARFFQHRVDQRAGSDSRRAGVRASARDADRGACLEAGEPIDLADVVALRHQHLLEALDAVARQALDRLPRADEIDRRIGADHIGDVADEDRVDVGVVIELQHREIVGGEEGGTLQSRRQHDEALIAEPLVAGTDGPSRAPRRA